jgi:hypothetical protein
VPRDHWLDPEEKKAILDFHDQLPLEGYRRLTFMMLDRDIAAASPATVYRVLKNAGRIGQRPVVSSLKGTGFWVSLTAAEQARVLGILLERVEYDGAVGKVSVQFRPTGLHTLIEELTPENV